MNLQVPGPQGQYRGTVLHFVNSWFLVFVMCMRISVVKLLIGIAPPGHRHDLSTVCSTLIDMYIYIYIHVYAYAYVYVYVYVYVCVYICKYIYIYIYVYSFNVAAQTQYFCIQGHCDCGVPLKKGT